MTLTLALPPSAISAPTRNDLDIVGAAMLWPHDETQRKKAIETSRVEMLNSIADQLSRTDLVDLVALAKDVTPLSDIHDLTKQCMVDGVRSGLYLREAVGHVSLDLPVSMKQLAAKVSTLPPVRNAHTFENSTWPRYRPVSHFWAAWLTECSRRTMPNSAMRAWCRWTRFYSTTGRRRGAIPSPAGFGTRRA
jgi:hypothetical protein